MLPVCFTFYRGERIFFEAGPRQVTTWCQRDLPPNTPVLVHDAGYLSYSSTFQMIDIVGLKTPWAIPLNQQLTWPTAGADRGQAVARIAMRSGSRYLILNSAWEPVMRLPDQLRALGWQVNLQYGAGTFRIYQLSPPFN